ncbi:4Fe-4S dicluster domain-containing protein [Neomoorella humiferrea]|uniref:Tetrathionate reductase subunit B n=1 Tax=Neomoorella humiferrea TaxID=676965 RepID=A0A2T0AWC7_9FIRM|nr:4Fe-4S dicluster domain-containing protein [Moorella humiferrea]PRR75044.1 Tetrathionate reductase subunit B precursor [Moorella humiferrea]
MTRLAMIFDLKKCAGCYACVVSCKMENGTRPGVNWNHVHTVEWAEFPSARQTFIPTQCMHCDNPPCVKVCPTGASTKMENGIVAVDYDKCIGCRYCLSACPYEARIMNERETTNFKDKLMPYEEELYKNHRLNVAEKCTFCIHRVTNGKLPACVVNCPGKARIFGDLDAPDSAVKKYIEKHQAINIKGTSIYYVPPAGLDLSKLPPDLQEPAFVSFWKEVVHPAGKAVMGIAAVAVASSIVIHSIRKGE